MSTTAKRKKLREDDPLRHPFPPKVMERARAIAERYQITLWREDGQWFGVGVEEPGTYGDGRTIVQCMRDVREALAVTVPVHLENGQTPAKPIVDEAGPRRRRAG